MATSEPERCLIFDLSEVLIAGLAGVEHELAPLVGRAPAEVLDRLGGPAFEALLTGRLAEEEYLAGVVAREGWALDVPALQAAVRRNFHTEVEGMASLLKALAGRCRLALLSDHAREWMAYIYSVYPWLTLFPDRFFSYELGTLKNDPATFRAVLRALGCAADECLFIDDNPANLCAAESLGMGTILFEGARQLAAELERRGLLEGGGWTS